MTNWKTYKIINKEDNSSWIRFHLNDYVNYKNTKSQTVDCKKILPFNKWRVKDYIEIDNDATISLYSTYEFINTEKLRLAGSSSSTALVRAQADYSVLQNRYHDLQTTNSGLSSENYRLNQLIEAGKQLLENKNSTIATYDAKLTVAESQLSAANNQLELFRGLNTGLQISSNNKDNKIGQLETSLDKTKEKNYQYKLLQQEQELEKFIQEQGINRDKVWDLRKAYQKLIQSRENYNQTNIGEARESIEKVKSELLKGGWFTRKVSVDNVQKLCRDCEKIAKSTIEQDRFYQERQYQAQQEVPPRSN